MKEYKTTKITDLVSVVTIYDEEMELYTTFVVGGDAEGTETRYREQPDIKHNSMVNVAKNYRAPLGQEQ